VTQHVPVIIVGGGAAGLSAAGAMAQRGVKAVVLEQDAAIGGTWARRYDRLHLHTIRQFSGLAHFPIPQRYPRYLSRDQFVEYLQEYARYFKLRVVTGTSVQKIRPSHSRGREWIVDTPEGNWHGRGVVVATGQYGLPMIPPWPGRECYSGRLDHSASYATAAPYAGLRVLVVGAGNSGAEIATDLSEHGAAAVTISVRTPPPIVPRDPFGMPVQRTSILLSALPPAVANFIGRTTARMVIGDLTRYGMPKPDFMPYSTRRVPMIDVGFVDALKSGRVTVRAAVERLTPNGAIFADGGTGSFDSIIAATGFTAGIETLLDAPGALDEHGEPRGRSGEPTAHPGLYFNGFIHSLRGHLFEANMSSRRLARNLERFLGHPAERGHA
jgi:putative flavoprotein involved in K+ transport